MAELIEMRCAGTERFPCSARAWRKVGVVSAQKGTNLFQCDVCKRVIIIKGDIPLTDDPRASI